VSPPGITYVTTAQNWQQTGISTALTGCPTGASCSTQTLTLNAGFVGVDVTTGLYQIYLSDGANSEAVTITGGTYPSGGTVTFVPYFNHPASSTYTAESASSGIQETINNACGINSSPTQMGYCNITIPAIGIGYIFNRYKVYGTIFFHAYQSFLTGFGVRLECYGRGPCLQMGDRVSASDYASNTISGINFATLTNYSSIPAYEGVNITNTSFSGGVATITTATAHGFRPGDIVAIEFTDSSSYWGDAIIATVPTATTFTYSHTGSPPSQNTPGVVALEYAAILDNAESTHFDDIQYDLGGENGQFNNFFDMWDDENAVISHFTAVTKLNGNIDWTRSYVFSGGQSNIGHNLAPVITLRDSTSTAGDSNRVTDYNSNGLYVENTVCQSTGLWQVYSSSGNSGTGNFQGAYLKNIYSESSIAANPACSSYPASCSAAESPFPGTGIAGLIAGPTASGNFVISGSGTLGEFQTGGTGSTPYSYFIVANDWTGASCGLGTQTQTSPMQVLNWESTGSDSPLVLWPRVANGTDSICYDVIRIPTPIGVGAPFPSPGNCNGGSVSACGYVAHNLTQATACSGNLVCSHTDTAANSTVAYTINIGDYSGSLSFWPGSLVSVTSTVAVDGEESPAVGVGLDGAPIQTASVCGLGHGSGGGGGASPGGYSVCLATTMSNDVPTQAATILSDGTSTGGGDSGFPKGRLNFTTSPFATILPHHIITLIDSQPALTQATSGLRPPASTSDTWIGTHVSNSGRSYTLGQLAFGAPVSISSYIAKVGNPSTDTPLETLSSSLKTFNVPIKLDAATVGTLPLASSFPGVIMYVTDSTAITTEGQTCAGSSSNKALAFSNGSSWKCF
jgi:hypothetical protein